MIGRGLGLGTLTAGSVLLSLILTGKDERLNLLESLRLAASPKSQIDKTDNPKEIGTVSHPKSWTEVFAPH